MKDELLQIEQDSLESIEKANDLRALDDVRVSIFGKKSQFSLILRGMGGLSAEERPVMGQIVNEVREKLENALNLKKELLHKQEQAASIAADTIDVTLPGKSPILGNRHPMTIVTEQICKIFMGMGYEIAQGPDIETQFHNFEALNIHENHPARDEQDTFYVAGGHVLRTQTSPVQIRKMQEGKLPIAIVAPGKVFRSDEVDATHSPVFHQIEGLVVDKGIHMGHLKGALTVFAKALFGEGVATRFRPHHFPFTEPSAEMDVSCFGCNQNPEKMPTCKICKAEGWVELLGCGMVHPKVLETCGINPEFYSGFAFGMGLERIAMQRFNIDDMRLLFDNDMRFLQQF